ncbi:MAG: 5-oxoprolinase subunit PxpB [Sporomusaceae bacterium]|nr:5-oxoprolinase subunit PxpB [Sporomusaceae bacterium]
MHEIKMLNAGEQGLVVEFGQSIDKNCNLRVHQFAALISERLAGELIEAVPTYRSLLLYFDPLTISRADLAGKLRLLLAELERLPLQQPPGARLITIPVCYDGEFAPDLDFVASHCGLSRQAVIELHTAAPYQIYMLGFTPGYAYLGGMPERLATPRLQQPRTLVPAGSVGIGGSQTAFYTVDSPGGWQLIGRTPVKAFDLSQAPPFLFKAGDYLQFQAISRDEYEAIAAAVAAGSYKPPAANWKGALADDQD